HYKHPATTAIYPLSLHDALPIWLRTVGNPDVKPERGSEIEAGFDAALLGNRLGVELTYYHKKTSDALMRVPLIPSVVGGTGVTRSEEHTSELQSLRHLVCRLLLE